MLRKELKNKCHWVLRTMYANSFRRLYIILQIYVVDLINLVNYDFEKNYISSVYSKICICPMIVLGVILKTYS